MDKIIVDLDRYYTQCKSVSPVCGARRVSLLPVRLSFHLLLRPDRFLESKAEASSYISHEKTSP